MFFCPQVPHRTSCKYLRFQNDLFNNINPFISPLLLLYALQKHTSSRYARIRKVSAHSGKIPISRRVVYHIKRNDTDIIRDALSQDREL